MRACQLEAGRPAVRAPTRTDAHAHAHAHHAQARGLQHQHDPMLISLAAADEAAPQMALMPAGADAALEAGAVE